MAIVFFFSGDVQITNKITTVGSNSSKTSEGLNIVVEIGLYCLMLNVFGVFSCRNKIYQQNKRMGDYFAACASSN